MAGSSSQNKSPGSGYQGSVGGVKGDYSSRARQSYNTVINANQKANAPKNSSSVSKNNLGTSSWWGPGRGRGVSNPAVGTPKKPTVTKPTTPKKPTVTTKKTTVKSSVVSRPSTSSQGGASSKSSKSSSSGGLSRSTVGGGVTGRAAVSLGRTQNNKPTGSLLGSRPLPSSGPTAGRGNAADGSSGMSRSTVGGGVSGRANTRV